MCLKICSKCKLEKPVTEFRKGSGKDSLRASCRRCDLESGRSYGLRNSSRETVIIPELKVCLRCNLLKTNLEFHKSKSKKDGLNSACRECLASLHKASGDRNTKRSVIVVPDSKTCPGCERVRLSLEFGKCKRNTDGLQSYCKACRAIRQRDTTYGVTQEWFLQTLRDQGGCAICHSQTPGGKGSWHVDHDHLTGKVRGLLCNNCNLGIGHLRDSQRIIKAAIAYLLDCGFRKLDTKWDKSWGKTKVPNSIRTKILLGQAGLCKICLIELTLKASCLDHCHKTGFVRGCLCRSCNTGIGYFKDNVETLQKAIDYLNKHKS
jgi:hypothetical protein